MRLLIEIIDCVFNLDRSVKAKWKMLLEFLSFCVATPFWKCFDVWHGAKSLTWSQPAVEFTESLKDTWSGNHTLLGFLGSFQGSYFFIIQILALEKIGKIGNHGEMGKWAEKPKGAAKILLRGEESKGPKTPHKIKKFEKNFWFTNFDKFEKSKSHIILVKVPHTTQI